MMSLSEIANIRTMFPNYDLYYIKIASCEFIVRPITPREYSAIQDLSDSKYDEEDLVTQTSLIYPPNYSVSLGLGGAPKMISKIVLEISLLDNASKTTIANMFQSYMDALNDPNGIDAQTPVLIKMAFPEFSFEEIDEWTIEKKVLNLARALFVHKLKQTPGLDGYTINPNVSEQTEEITLEEKEKSLLLQGRDPMMELYNEYKTKPNLVDIPFITNRQWNDEGMINVIRKQIHESVKR